MAIPAQTSQQKSCFRHSGGQAGIAPHSYHTVQSAEVTGFRHLCSIFESEL